MGETTKVGRLYNVELFRFIGILLIMGHHLYLLGFDEGYVFQNCWAWVDFFFILTGAFTYKHFLKENESTNYGSVALGYTFNKFKSFLPFAILSVFIMMFIEYGNLLTRSGWKGFVTCMANNIFEAFFLSSTGISGTIYALNAPIWFLSAMFIAMPLMVYIIQANRELWKVLSLTLPILYFGYKGVNTDRMWPNDIVRAFVCMALGTMAYMLSQKVKEISSESNRNRVLFSLLELACLLASMFISVLNKPYMNLLEPLFVLIVALLFSQSTISSQIKSPIVSLLGSISMPIFMFHWCVGSLVILFTDDTKLRVILYYVCSIVVGLVVTMVSDFIKTRRRV